MKTENQIIERSRQLFPDTKPRNYLNEGLALGFRKGYKEAQSDMLSISFITEIIKRFAKYFNNQDYGSIEGWIIEDFINNELSGKEE